MNYQTDWSKLVFQALKLDLNFADSTKPIKPHTDTDTAIEQKTSMLSLRYGIFAGAVVLTSIGVLVYLKRSK